MVKKGGEVGMVVKWSVTVWSGVPLEGGVLVTSPSGTMEGGLVTTGFSVTETGVPLRGSSLSVTDTGLSVRDRGLLAVVVVASVVVLFRIRAHTSV